MSWGAARSQEPGAEHLFPTHKALKKSVCGPLLRAAGRVLGSLWSCAYIPLPGGVQVRCPWPKVSDRWLQLSFFSVSCPEWPFCAFTGGGSRWLFRTPVSLLWLRHTHALRGGKGKCFQYQRMLACLILLLACIASGWSQRCFWCTLA